MFCYNTIIIAKVYQPICVQAIYCIFHVHDIQAYNNALFAKCSIITQMNFLSGCNDVNCRQVTVFQDILLHNPEQKNTNIYQRETLKYQRIIIYELIIR